MSDIFDLTNVNDIPEEIKEGIVIDVVATRILELFKIANRPLSIDEITVGYYRKFKDKDQDLKTKRKIMAKVYNMSRERNAKIKSIEGKKGIYALCKEKIEEDEDNL